MLLAVIAVGVAPAAVQVAPSPAETAAYAGLGAGALRADVGAEMAEPLDGADDCAMCEWALKLQVKTIDGRASTLHSSG